MSISVTFDQMKAGGIRAAFAAAKTSHGALTAGQDKVCRLIAARALGEPGLVLDAALNGNLTAQADIVTRLRDWALGFQVASEAIGAAADTLEAMTTEVTHYSPGTPVGGGYLHGLKRREWTEDEGD